MTLVYCGSLASVHSHLPASTSRVSASCSTPLFTLFSGSSLQVPLCEHLARIDHVMVDWSCWKLLHRPTHRVRFANRTRASSLSTRGPNTRRHCSTRARYLWLRICGEPSASERQWAEIASEGGVLPLQPHCRLRYRSVCVRDSLLHSTRGLVATEQLRSLPEGFRLMRQPLRTWRWSCVIAQCHHGRYQIEASLLDSNLQGLLGTEELVGDESVVGPELQWAIHTQFPTIVRLLELNCCAIPLTAAGGVFAVPAKAVAGLSWESQGGEVVVALADGPSGIAHFSDSCPVVFLEGQRDSISEVPEGLSDSHQADNCHTHTHRRWCDLLHGTRDTVVSTKALYCPLPDPRKKNTRASPGLPVAKARGVKKAANRPTSQASMPSRIPGNSAVSYGRCRPQLAALESQLGCAHFDSRGSIPAMLGIPAASRKTSGPALQEANTASRIRILVKPVRAVPPEGDILPRQPLDLAEVLAKLAAVLDQPRNSR